MFNSRCFLHFASFPGPNVQLVHSGQENKVVLSYMYNVWMYSAVHKVVLHVDVPGMKYMHLISLVPRLPLFLCFVCIHNNTHTLKSDEKWGGLGAFITWMILVDERWMLGGKPRSQASPVISLSICIWYNTLKQKNDKTGKARANLSCEWCQADAK